MRHRKKQKTPTATASDATVRIILNDHPLLMMVVLIGVMWLFAVTTYNIVVFYGTTVLLERPLVSAAVVVTILFSWPALSRLRNLKRIIRNGHKVKGRIKCVRGGGISNLLNRGIDNARRVEFEYKIGGYTYQTEQELNPFRGIESENCETISLIVDPENPSRVLIVSNYT